MGREGSLPLQVEKVVWNVAVCFSLPVKALFQLTWLCRASETQDVLWECLAKVDTERGAPTILLPVLMRPPGPLHLHISRRQTLGSVENQDSLPDKQILFIHMERGRLADFLDFFLYPGIARPASTLYSETP